VTSGRIDHDLAVELSSARLESFTAAFEQSPGGVEGLFVSRYPNRWRIVSTSAKQTHPDMFSPFSTGQVDLNLGPGDELSALA
jgi:hypothetical protein